MPKTVKVSYKNGAKRIQKRTSEKVSPFAGEIEQHLGEVRDLLSQRIQEVRDKMSKRFDSIDTRLKVLVTNVDHRHSHLAQKLEDIRDELQTVVEGVGGMDDDV